MSHSSRMMPRKTIPAAATAVTPRVVERTAIRFPRPRAMEVIVDPVGGLVKR
jgi:hypothetical protein